MHSTNQLGKVSAMYKVGDYVTHNGDTGFVTRVYRNGDFILSDTLDNGLCQTDTTTDGIIVGGLAKEVTPRNPRRYSI